MIVVGDAAGQVKPTTGGGIYYGLLCADIAVDVLDRAIAGNDCSARALSEYERRWKKLLARELRIDRWARRAFERLSDRRMERLFRMVQEGKATESLLNAPDFSFDWHSRLILRALWRFGPRAAVFTGLAADEACCLPLGACRGVRPSASLIIPQDRRSASGGMGDPRGLPTPS